MKEVSPVHLGYLHLIIAATAFLALIFGHYLVMQDTIAEDIGTGFLSLTAREMNGYAPHILYRLMHNLTMFPALVVYFVVTVFIGFLPLSVRFKRFSAPVFFSRGILHVVYVGLYVWSTFLPVGDMVVIFQPE